MVKSIIYSLAMLFALSSCSLNKDKMTNLEIIKSTYEGKTSEENGKNLAKYVAEDISWTEAKGFPYAGTYIGLDNVTKNVFSRLGSEWIDYKFTPEDYVSSDDKVVA
jgi:ketosteroid isomerase-like protein